MAGLLAPFFNYSRYSPFLLLPLPAAARAASKNDGQAFSSRGALPLDFSSSSFGVEVGLLLFLLECSFFSFVSFRLPAGRPIDYYYHHYFFLFSKAQA